MWLTKLLAIEFQAFKFLMQHTLQCQGPFINDLRSHPIFTLLPQQIINKLLWFRSHVCNSVGFSGSDVHIDLISIASMCPRSSDQCLYIPYRFYFPPHSLAKDWIFSLPFILSTTATWYLSSPCLVSLHASGEIIFSWPFPLGLILLGHSPNTMVWFLFLWQLNIEWDYSKRKSD